MTGMTGADVDDLERGASRLESVGTQIGGMRRPLRSQLYSSSWDGRAAVGFRSDWDRIHGPALAEADEFLRRAGQNLRTQADEQRRASNMGGGGAGSSPPGSTGAESPKEQLEELRELLASIGVPYGEISGLLEKLGWLGDIGVITGPLKALLDNEILKGAMVMAGTALSFAALAMDYLTVVLDNAHLPPDEQMVLATATVGVGLAVDLGIDTASQAIGAAIAGGLTGGTAVVVGKIVGKVVGTVLNKGFDAVDDQLNLTDQVAEQTLDAYRYSKERDFDPVRIGWDAAGDAVDGVVDGTENLAKSTLARGRGLLGISQ